MVKSNELLFLENQQFLELSLDRVTDLLNQEPFITQAISCSIPISNQISTPNNNSISHH